jgi:hypothetical protein
VGDLPDAKIGIGEQSPRLLKIGVREAKKRATEEIAYLTR